MHDRSQGCLPTDKASEALSAMDEVRGARPELYRELASLAAVGQQFRDHWTEAAVILGTRLAPALDPVKVSIAFPEIDHRLALLDEMRSQFVAIVTQPPTWMNELHAAAIQLTEAFRQQTSQLSELLTPAISVWEENRRRCDQVEAAGWLPHHTTPWSHVDMALDDPTLVNKILEEYYSHNWRLVRNEFVRRLRKYAIDDEAKTLFRQALTAHRQGHYRLCVRALFPEIERLVRKELTLPKRGGVIVALTNALDNVGMSDIEPGGWYAMHLFDKLETQAYASVWNDADATVAARFEAPSRHAAIHGWVAYADHRSSMNALIMADYAFGIISATKLNRASTQDGVGREAA
jgi:hypothetical protein